MSTENKRKQLRIAKFIYIAFKQGRKKHCTKLSIINIYLSYFKNIPCFNNTCIYSMNCLYTFIYTYDYVCVHICCGH